MSARDPFQAFDVQRNTRFARRYEKDIEPKRDPDAIVWWACVAMVAVMAVTGLLRWPV